VNLEKALRLNCSDGIVGHALFLKHGNGQQTTADCNEIQSRFYCIWHNTHFAFLGALSSHPNQLHTGALNYAQCAAAWFFRSTVCGLSYMFQTGCTPFDRLYMFFVCRRCWTFDCKTRLKVFRFYILSITSQQVIKNRGLVVGSLEDFAVFSA
jgi:hypothetical protein